MYAMPPYMPRPAEHQLLCQFVTGWLPEPLRPQVIAADAAADDPDAMDDISDNAPEQRQIAE